MGRCVGEKGFEDYDDDDGDDDSHSSSYHQCSSMSLFSSPSSYDVYETFFCGATPHSRHTPGVVARAAKIVASDAHRGSGLRFEGLQKALGFGFGALWFRGTRDKGSWLSASPPGGVP